MKKILILLICLCLTFCIVACNNTPVDSDSDTGTDTEQVTDSDSGTDVSSDNENTVKYTITVIDQYENAIAGAKIVLIDEFDEYDYNSAVTTDENGVVEIEITNNEFVAIRIVELPEYHLNTAGTVKLEDEKEITLSITNNTPNGTAQHPYYMADEENFTVSIDAGKTVYYTILGGGGRILTIENCPDGFKLYFDGIEYVAEAGTIMFIIPSSEASSNARPLAFENTGAEKITVSGTIVSPKGSLENPHEAVCGVLYEETIEKGFTVYYEWVATETGTAVITSETVGNSIYMQNLTTVGTIVSESTNGGTTTELDVTEGDVIRIVVSSILDSNYNTVEFKLELVLPDAES